MVVGQHAKEGERASYLHSRHPLGLPLPTRIAWVNKTGVPSHRQRRFDPQPPDRDARLPDFPLPRHPVPFRPPQLGARGSLPPSSCQPKTPLRNQPAGSHEHPLVILAPKSPVAVTP